MTVWATVVSGSLPPATTAEQDPAFLAWADLDALDHVEVILAAPSTVTPGSLFGHLGLLLVYRDDAGELPITAARSVAYTADTEGGQHNDPLYVWKGMAGAYRARLQERPFLSTYTEYVVRERRDLRRWRLALDAEERMRLMQAIWAERAGSGRPYYFFTQNCASLLLALVNRALPPDRRRHVSALQPAPPAVVLERLDDGVAVDGGPLLIAEPRAFVSYEHEARAAAHLRAWLLREAPPEIDRGVRRGLEATEAWARRASYQTLVTRMPADPSARRWLGQVLSYSAVIELHLFAWENAKAEEAIALRQRRDLRQELLKLRRELVAGAAAWPFPTPLPFDDLSDVRRARRMNGYRAVRAALDGGVGAPWDDRWRRLVLLTSESYGDAAAMRAEPGLRDGLLFPEPRRTLGQQRFARGCAPLIDPPEVQRLSPGLLAVQEARARYIQAVGQQAPDVVSADGSLRETAAVAEEAPLAGSGLGNWSAGTFVQAANAAGPMVTATGVWLSSALWRERLGERRRFGFGGRTELVVAQSRALLAVDPDQGKIEWNGFDARVFGLRWLPPVPSSPLLSSGTRGFEVNLDVESNQLRGIRMGLDLEAGLLWAAGAAPDFSQHRLFGIGAGYSLRMTQKAQGTVSHWAVLPVRLEQVLPFAAFGRRGHSLRAGGWLRPQWELMRQEFFMGWTAALETRFQLGRASEGGRASFIWGLNVLASHDSAPLVTAEGVRASANLRALVGLWLE